MSCDLDAAGSGSRSSRSIHQSISARSASSSSRSASASWRASSGGTDARARLEQPRQRLQVGERGALGRASRSPSQPARRHARRAARSRAAGLGLAHEPVGGGVGLVELRAHLAERVALSHWKLTSSEPSANDADDGR